MPLHYREDFSCTAVFKDKRLSKEIEIPADFSMESNALGKKTVKVTLKEPVNYPLIPLKQSIREYVLALDKERKIR